MGDFLADVANLSTVMLILASTSALLLRGVRPVRMRLLGECLRLPLVAPKHWHIIGVEALLGLPSERWTWRHPIRRIGSWWIRRRRARWLRRTFFEPIARRLDGEDVNPSDVIARVMASPAFSRRAPWDGVSATLAQVCRAAGTYRSTRFVVRVLYPDESVMIRNLFAEMANHLDRFGTARPVSLGRFPRPEGPRSFGRFVSALSGAVVLVDSVDTRTKYVDDVLVWHRQMYRGVGTPEPGGKGRGQRRMTDQYAAAHPDGGVCSTDLDASQRLIGDFDRRVLTLRSAWMTEASSRGRVSFVLETSETCYLATEHGEAMISEGAPQDERVGCKHLFPNDTLGGAQQFVADADGGYQMTVSAPDSGPTMLLTSYISLLTSDGFLVLVRRSGSVRHGTGTISAMAGGVIEPDGDGSAGDVDQYGMPSPLECVIRETREEIGLDLSGVPINPVCVFLVNVRNLSGKRRGRGQLVAVTLYLASVSHTRQELNEIVKSADPALGGFEVEHLVYVDCDTDSDEANAFSSAMARFAWDHRQQLDQHGLLSCLYSAAVHDGAGAARDAFESAFSSGPWWMHPGYVAGTEDNGVPADVVVPRVVRDPRQLVVSSTGSWPEQMASMSESWRPSWEALPDSLTAARASTADDLGQDC